MDFSLSDYQFELPEELIAQTPVSPRDASRLLVLNRKTGEIQHRMFADLPSLLQSKDVLVANHSQVIPARLLGFRLGEKNERCGKVEFFLLEEISPLVWEGMFHASAKHRPGVRFEIPMQDGSSVRGELIRGASESPSGTVVARFERDPLPAGQLPLPPYIERAPVGADLENYQTVYAKVPGSSAAPTAGLHFTHRILQELKQREIAWEEIRLDVGLGTFRPVKVEDIRNHVMHEERFWIAPEVAARLKETVQAGRRIIAVGTTTVRTLESAWNPVSQQFQDGAQRTQVFLYPGGPKTIQVISGLITNFHLPGSTLLMLVSAFAGRELTLAAYREAVKERYRFFSYGDAMLIL